MTPSTPKMRERPAATRNSNDPTISPVLVWVTTQDRSVAHESSASKSTIDLRDSMLFSCFWTAWTLNLTYGLLQCLGGHCNNQGHKLTGSRYALSTLFRVRRSAPRNQPADRAGRDHRQ